ncbi:saccharopine dehydrogenase family protein [Cellulomonas fimi]|uniref:Saccharopine dehydrogenase n=1 Tax=Cellulomonas fimi (strain ATCC 484 / DSM 20113 / JCM 1341 / CCUG 24087 / LMG 16345 / NBRC 15513 / NCIMB 8980 / NCTC 7547 / NRS-133) TaxID=590998 RepID=F4H3S7_CELFA|nr:saccharopine dehydrogenase NADP-binding domain-containing protein [Cellulomonas fimi]AEE47743.1 Saccharopine dehydrogenase [Cellulomonas fimi ATCC 484]NNH06718.1 enoyl-ACP reductase [Cellulomonas fimi]VEH36915.1 Putative trans-acting enoyl reductase Rv2449c [Cellulomonas fimi]
MTTRTHDLVLFGATGFVGALVAEHVAQHAPPGLRVALAGRSRSRLAELRDRLPAGAADWPLVVADAADETGLAALAADARVVVSTVGPYAEHGLPLAAACARAGTHYADLTGEVPFVRRVADDLDDVARASGARLVHACGYDSVPSDLAVLLLHRAAAADDAGDLRDVRLLARARGGVSGGTVASMRGIAVAAAGSRDVRRLLADPFALSPDRTAEPAPPQPADAPPPRRLADGTWTAPFLMASFNSRVVRRSNALQGWAYGRGLRYGEAMGVGRGPRAAVAAVAVTAGLGGGAAALAFPPTRAVLDRWLPGPGEGPDARTRERGWFRMDAVATTTSGRRYRAQASGPGDPGYAATAVMLGQTALALTLDEDRLPDRAGSLTPAAGMGDVLVDRLRAAGHTYAAAGAAGQA